MPSERIIASGDSFERHVSVNEPCVLSFNFSVAEDLKLEFSVLLRPPKGKDRTMLPATTYNALSGEVLVDRPGTCIARWHNANTSWLWSYSATLKYSLSHTTATAPASTQPSRTAATAQQQLGPPSPGVASYEERMQKAVEEALAKAMQTTKGGACPSGCASLVTSGLASPARGAPTVRSPRRVNATAAPATTAQPPAPLAKKGSKNRGLTIEQPAASVAAVPPSADQTGASNSNAEEEFGSLLEAAAAVRLQSANRVRLARQTSEERRLFAAAVEAATDEKMREIDQSAFETEIAAQIAAAKSLGVMSLVALAAVRLQSKVRSRKARALAAERRAFVAESSASYDLASRTLERQASYSDAIIAARVDHLGGRRSEYLEYWAPRSFAFSALSTQSEFDASLKLLWGERCMLEREARRAEDAAAIASAAAAARRDARRAAAAAGGAAGLCTPPPATSSAARPLSTPASEGLASPSPLSGPLPLSALSLLDELGLGKYKQRFLSEDLTETTMFTAMVQSREGAQDLRAILKEVGLSIGHSQRVLTALTTRPPPVVR